MRARLIPVFAVLVLAGGGCDEPRPALSLNSPDSAIKIEAMKQIVRERHRDVKTLKELVAELDNRDSAVRLFAYLSLNTLTGQSFDYNWTDESEQRKPAVAQWRNWVAQQEQPAVQPTTSTAQGNGG